MKLTAFAMVIIGSLSSCVTMGNAHLELTLRDKNGRFPLPGASVLAYYQTVVFGPVALPGRVKAITDSRGIADFKHLADGHWTVRADIHGRESQEAYFYIEEGHIGFSPNRSGISPPQTGRVTGNPCADPVRPALFFGRLVKTER